MILFNKFPKKLIDKFSILNLIHKLGIDKMEGGIIGTIDVFWSEVRKYEILLL